MMVVTHIITEVVKASQAAKRVVFHCMKSQVRGKSVEASQGPHSQLQSVPLGRHELSCCLKLCSIHILRTCVVDTPLWGRARCDTGPSCARVFSKELTKRSKESDAQFGCQMYVTFTTDVRHMRLLAIARWLTSVAINCIPRPFLLLISLSDGVFALSPQHDPPKRV